MLEEEVKKILQQKGEFFYENTLTNAASYRDFSDEARNMRHFCAESLKLALAYLLMSKKQKAKSEFQQAKECFENYFWQRRCS